MKVRRFVWASLLCAGGLAWILLVVGFGADRDETIVIPPDTGFQSSDFPGDGTHHEGDRVPVATAPAHSAAEDVVGTSNSGTTRACVNVNEADHDMLMSLPGIGRVTADRIVAYRKENGPFTDSQSLLRVKGVGPARLVRIKGLICFQAIE